VIETEGGAVVVPPVAAGAAKTAPPAASPARPVAPAKRVDDAASSTAAAASPADRESVRSSPLVRKLAQEHNIDLASVIGTGAGGRISKKDIDDAIAAGAERVMAAPASGAAAQIALPI